MRGAPVQPEGSRALTVRRGGAALLARLGLGRPELRAWALYDWGQSAFVTTVVTAVFPVYFQEVLAAGLAPAAATARYAAATTIALGAIAVAAPALGALADVVGGRKRLLALCLGLGVVATAGLAATGAGQWRLALVLFALGNVGAFASLVAYDALLPHVARPGELDRVSIAGYALGYLGGGLLLALNLAWILRPGWFGLADAAAASRAAFLSVAAWWAAFSLPLLRRVPEPRPRRLVGERPEAPWRSALARLRATARGLRRHRQAFLLLLAILVYNDGIVTVYRMAVLYGSEIGLPRAALIGAVVMVQFLGVPCAWLFAALAGRIGARPAIFAGLAAYAAVCVYAYFLDSAGEFFVLAAGVAAVQGGTQALSRSLFAGLVPVHRTAEFFGFFSLADKFAGIAGPAVFGLAAALSGSSRWAVLVVLGFFLAGGALLAAVDVERGRREARAAEAEIAEPV